MTPSHKRNRTKVAGRWVLPGTVIEFLEPQGPHHWTSAIPAGSLRVVMKPDRVPGFHPHGSNFKLLDPVTGNVRYVAAVDLTASRVRIVSDA